MNSGMDEHEQNGVGPNAAEPPDDLLGALRRKVALNVGDDEYQRTQQDKDLDGVIHKKLYAAAKAALHIDAEHRQNPADERVEPFHAQHLILKKQPDGL